MGAIETATGYVELSVIQIAAKYLFKFVKNHCFNDGNKRTGAMLALAYLELHNISVNISEEELINGTLAVANNTMTEEDIVMWIQQSVITI